MADTEKVKNDLHQMIDQIEDQATLEAIRTLLAPQIGAIYSLPGQLLSQEETEDLLEESEADIEASRTITHQALKDDMQSWRKHYKRYNSNKSEALP